MTAAQTRETLRKYADQTAADASVDLAAAIRMMAAESPEVARNVGCTRDDVENWCRGILICDLEPLQFPAR